MARDDLPLTDQLFLAAVDPRSGHLAVDPDLLGIGLAAVLLAQLENEGLIAISTDGVVHQHGSRRPPTGVSPVITTAIGQIADEPDDWNAQVWLRFWATDRITDRVAQRLESVNVLLPATRRGLIHRKKVYRTVAESDQWWWRSRLRMFLTDPQRYTPTYMDLLMLGVGDAIGLRGVLLADTTSVARDILEYTSSLPGSLGLLVRYTHVVAADTTLT